MVQILQDAQRLHVGTTLDVFADMSRRKYLANRITHSHEAKLRKAYGSLLEVVVGAGSPEGWSTLKAIETHYAALDTVVKAYEYLEVLLPHIARGDQETSNLLSQIKAALIEAREPRRRSKYMRVAARKKAKEKELA